MKNDDYIVKEVKKRKNFCHKLKMNKTFYHIFYFQKGLTRFIYVCERYGELAEPK